MLNTHKIGFKFLGYNCGQAIGSIFVWEKLFECHPKQIIDLGTWEGGFSLYLYLNCLVQKIDFYTFDNKKLFQDDEFLTSIRFPEKFQQLDIFTNIEMIGNLIAKEGQSIVFCDNGNKPEEFKQFSPFMKLGDIIGVHDWGIEIAAGDVKEPCEKYKLKMIHEEECLNLDNNIRFFQKI